MVRLSDVVRGEVSFDAGQTTGIVERHDVDRVIVPR
jgi:hypothetical protein